MLFLNKLDVVVKKLKPFLQTVREYHVLESGVLRVGLDIFYRYLFPSLKSYLVAFYDYFTFDNALAHVAIPSGCKITRYEAKDVLFHLW